MRKKIKPSSFRFKVHLRQHIICCGHLYFLLILFRRVHSWLPSDVSHRRIYKKNKKRPLKQVSSKKVNTSNMGMMMAIEEMKKYRRGKEGISTWLLKSKPQSNLHKPPTEEVSITIEPASSLTAFCAHPRTAVYAYTHARAPAYTHARTHAFSFF